MERNIYPCKIDNFIQVDTEEQGRRRIQEQESERDQKFTAWGYKFEQFMSVQVIVNGLGIQVRTVYECSGNSQWSRNTSSNSS